MADQNKTPGILLRWDHKPAEIEELAQRLVADTRAALDAIGQRPLESVTFENTVRAMAEADTLFTVESNMLEFYQFVSPNKEVRTASVEAEKVMSAFTVEWGARVDLYQAVKTCSERKEPLAPEDQRYMDHLLRDFRRNGLHLDEQTHLKVKDLKQRQSNITIDFDKHLNEENTKLTFGAEDLEGLPEDFLAGLDKDEAGQYIVTLKYPHYIPLMKKCINPATRRQMEFAYNTRCKEPNVGIVEELARLRHETATTLGYPTHAAYITEARMAKTPENVKKFLQELQDKVMPMAAADMKSFLKLKEDECAKRGMDFDGKINAWDTAYYMERLKEARYNVDYDKIKQYFPMEAVTAGLMHIYQELLGLAFAEVTGAETWHEDVTLYSVTDSQSKELLGYFYLDLYPREAKYSHAACFGLQPGCRRSDGTKQVAVAACVANFTKPCKDIPALLLHNEVETFFHEFGHVMHQLCAQVTYCYFAGTRVERDFVEAPSQMLENWCWQEESLRWLSCHYQTREKLPGDLLASLVAARQACAGYAALRQVFLATLDQTIYSQPATDTEALLASLATALGLPYTPGTNMVGSFGHVARGYDAQYYGYLWSEVFGFDMFESRFMAEGVMNGAVGRDYREKILKPGGTRDGSDMLKDFLGRDPKPDAFLRIKLGLA